MTTDTAFIGSTANYTASGNYISSIVDSFETKLLMITMKPKVH